MPPKPTVKTSRYNSVEPGPVPRRVAAASEVDSTKLSPLGRQLLAIRERYFANGGRLQPDKECAGEIYKSISASV